MGVHGALGITYAHGEARLSEQSRLGRAAPWVVPAAAASVVALLQGGIGLDSALFVDAGKTLLSADWSRAFSHASTQAGPLQLAVFGSIGRSGMALAIVLAAVTSLLVVAAANAVGTKQRALVGGIGVLAVVAGLTRVGYETGHPADAMLPLIWILAAAEARRGRALLAGLLVGLCAGIETWGILGVGVLAVAPRRRDGITGWAAAAAVAAALFLPFLLTGHFAMGTYRWQVTPPSALSLVLPPGTAFGWPLRIAQGALAVSAGLAASRVLRHSPHVLWVAPLAVVAARLLFDPQLLSYYLAGVQGPVFVGAALGASRVVVLRKARADAYAGGLGGMR